MKKQKFICAFTLGAIAMGTGITASLAVDSSATSLEVNPEYNQYIQSVQSGHASDWKLIPQKYINKVNASALQGPQFRANDTLPIAYDLRDEACGDGTCATRVKDQGQEGICWAYATTTSLESYLLKTTGKRIEVSPKQLDYALASPSTALSDSETNNYYTFLKGLGIDRTLGYGGNFMIANYFIGSNYGATLEAPFFAGMQANDPDLSAYSTYEQRAAIGPYNVKMPSGLIFNASKENNYSGTETAYYVVNSSLPEIFRQVGLLNIKQHLMEYGALQVGTYFNESSSRCYDSATKTIMDHGSLTCGASNGHSMSIIGWDDNHSYTDPDTNATKQGAFLIQNSWGEGIPETYVWMAYDYNVEASGFTGAEQNRWDIVYDVAKAQQLGDISRAPNEVISKYHAAGEQVIDKITLMDQFIATTTDPTWEIYVSTTGQESDFQKVGTASAKQLLTGGFRTVALDKSITVNGDFLIKAKYLDEATVIEDDEAPMFALNAYATGDIGPQPGPSPDPDIPVPNTDGGPTVGAPNTGFFSNGGAILATIVVAPITLAGFVAGRNLARRYGHRVSFKK